MHRLLLAIRASSICIGLLALSNLSPVSGVAHAETAATFREGKLERCSDNLKASADLDQIYRDDQGARSGPGPKDWDAIRKADADRRTRVRGLLDAGKLRCSTDYLRAAFVFQHGEAAEDYLLAHVLSSAASEQGEMGASWLAAATLDRYLMAIGRPQVFGTQFNTPKGLPTSQEPYDRQLLPDHLRAAFDVPNRAKQDRQRESYDASRGNLREVSRKRFNARARQMMFGQGLRRRVTPLMQSEAAECGLACLGMVAGFHGQQWKLYELRQMFSVSLKGATLSSLLDIAGRLGFSTRAIRIELDDLPKLAAPSILHWDCTHFVVLTKASDRWIEIADPAVGIRRVSMEEASRHFSGVALELAPTPEFAGRRAVRSVRLRDLWSNATGIGTSVAQLLVLSVLLQLLSLFLPLTSQFIIDDALAKADFDLLTLVAIAGALLLAMQLGSNLLRGFVQLHLTTSLTFQMRSNLLQHLLRLPILWFEKRNLGDVLSRFNSLQAVHDLLTGGLVTVAIDGLMTMLTMVIMFVYAPWLAAIVLGSLILLLAVRVATLPVLQRMTLESIQHQAKADTIFLETIRGVRAVKLFGRERDRHAVWQNAYSDTINNLAGVQRLKVFGVSGAALQAGAENLIVLALGARAVVHGEMSLGMLLAFQAYRLQFSTASASLIDQLIKYWMLTLHLERLGDVVHQPREADEILNFTNKRDRVIGGVEARGVSFRYADHEPLILKDVSFAIQPGEFVAFVGPSGGGKSTLLKVLMGIYPPGAGEVAIDGTAISTFGLRAFRERMGCVMQDDHLFAGTIADNIAFFDPELDMERVEEVAKIAAVHDEITRMPMGYFTLVGDLGSALSGGQQQRLLLARALYRQPTMLFLDEGTANLDMFAERRVMQAFADLKMTRVVAAHRPTAIEGCDRVFHVENGDVREVKREPHLQSIAG